MQNRFSDKPFSAVGSTRAAGSFGVFEECFKNHLYTCLQVLLSLYLEIIQRFLVTTIDRAQKRSQRSCGRLWSEVFDRKANDFILTTTYEKTIALMHRE